jgi:hypothetical protein
MFIGCGSGAKDQPIPLDQVPAEYQKAAKAKLPDVKSEQAIKRTDGTYEVRGRDKAGRVRDVELSATGEVIAVE